MEQFAANICSAKQICVLLHTKKVYIFFLMLRGICLHGNFSVTLGKKKWPWHEVTQPTRHSCEETDAWSNLHCFIIIYRMMSSKCSCVYTEASVKDLMWSQQKNKGLSRIICMQWIYETGATALHVSQNACGPYDISLQCHQHVLISMTLNPLFRTPLPLLSLVTQPGKCSSFPPLLCTFTRRHFHWLKTSSAPSSVRHTQPLPSAGWWKMKRHRAH